MKGLEFGFSASGWLMMWELGVAYSLQRHGVSESDAKFAGSSGGAAVSAALALGVDAKLVADYMVRCCAHWYSNPLRNMWKMREYAESCLERCLSESSHEHEGLTSGRLNVQVTLLPSVRGKLINKFASKEELLNAVRASCTMSPVAGMPFQYVSADKDIDGAWVFDGGLTAVIPVLSEDTITVCPVYFMDADIKPSRFVPIHWAVFPPSLQEFQELFWLGARDGMVWLHEQGYGSFSSHPHDLISELKVQQKLASKTTRIKPLQTRMQVSSHSSYDLQKLSMNPHACELIELRQRSISWSSMGSSDTEDSFSSLRVQRIISHDAALAGVPMSLSRENASRMGDSMLVAVAGTLIKPMALSIVYTELWSRAAVSAANAAFAFVEEKRRAKKPSKGGWLSLRRWVHEEMIGTAPDSWEAATSYLGAAVDPSAWIAHVPVVGSRLIQSSQAEQTKQKFEKHSISYRLLSRASLI
mmetsp:Transcript_1760/g.4120  ORF Transcript_1760/g.4120 Transcript_1760/m.4120 type:complete len:472 (+) Transcript_1760:220-1635(+)|eukprot:CAMPEP_0171507378 /NCGR_PEP_ID=MMETSP0958-20121227/13492_1 /TAXON_ID=87120 /ORGANISM="Aurantiochytrium limacinum, Strain ATCCMYA-1381" /LENGTH=471 /DNA_ID=CAMNT_0012044121 /DNA_START=981 /DNA_END=2396 /DNA_ORIENTATION=+